MAKRRRSSMAMAVASVGSGGPGPDKVEDVEDAERMSNTLFKGLYKDTRCNTLQHTATNERSSSRIHVTSANGILHIPEATLLFPFPGKDYVNFIVKDVALSLIHI